MMSLTELTASSNGIVRRSSTSSGLAPGSAAETTTSGISTSGLSVRGKLM